MNTMADRGDGTRLTAKDYELAFRVGDLRRERRRLIDRVRPGVAGVADLRCRLRIVTHKLLKAEMAL